MEMQEKEISVKEVVIRAKRLFYYILAQWKYIAMCAMLGGAIGFFFAYSKKPLYTAECTFVLEDASGGGSFGQYAGLASMVGIDLGTGGSNGIFHGDNIFELYKSRLMIEKTLLTPINIQGRKELLIDRYISFKNLRKDWKGDPTIRNIQFNKDKAGFTVSHDSIISSVVSDINRHFLKVEKPDKKLSIISVQVETPDELFSKAFAEEIVNNVNEFYVATKSKKAAENLSILQRQADSVRRVLNASIGGAASAIDANPNANPALQILRVPSQRRQVDVQASSAIYAEVAKNLEIAKISLRKETPLIQVIDRPVLPLPESRLGAIKGLILGTFLLGFLSIVFFTFRKIAHSIMN